ncbi:MAG: hypothetical protein JW797_04940 [Bradymonadales bacterium]|nr:hypothetical protein [Bradymonadales bacterium]
MAGWKQSKRIIPGFSFLLVLPLLLVTPALAQAQESGGSSLQAVAQAPPPTHQQQIWLFARGGWGSFTEDHLDQQSTIGLGAIEGVWYPANTTRVSAEFAFNTYERQFQPIGVGRIGQITVVERREYSLEGNATCGFNTLFFTPVDLWAYAGWRHIFFLNDGFDRHFTGGVAGLQLEYPIVDLLGFQAFVDHTFNLLSLDDPIDEVGDSLVGLPLASMRFGGGFRFTPGDFIEVGVAYEGNWLSYEYSDLLLHQIVFEAAYIFRI